MGARPQNPDDQAIYALLLSMYDAYGQTPRRGCRAAPRPGVSLTARLGICGGALALTVLSSAGLPAIRDRAATDAVEPRRRTIVALPAATAPAVAMSPPARSGTVVPAVPVARRPAPRRMRVAALPSVLAVARGDDAEPDTVEAVGVVHRLAPISAGAGTIAVHEHDERRMGEEGSYAFDGQAEERARPRRALDAIRTLRLH